MDDIIAGPKPTTIAKVNERKPENIHNHLCFMDATSITQDKAGSANQYNAVR